MAGPRLNVRTDWLFYLFLVAYGALIIRMTLGLWSDAGINVFATYSSAATPTEMIVDANKVYWSKTCFLFGTLLLAGLNVDLRAAVGLAATFWSVSLIVMFGASPNLVAALVAGTLLVAQQVWRRQFFVERTEKLSPASRETLRASGASSRP
ncbi:MAG: hypothetical protein AAF997_10870 [Myxococcota bacterium]